MDKTSLTRIVTRKSILVIISSLKHGGGAEKIASMVGSCLNSNGKYSVKYLTFYDAKKKYNFSGEEICLNEKLSNNIFINFLKLIIRAYKIKQVSKKEGVSVCISFMEEANFSNILSKIIFSNNSKIIISIRQSANARGRLYKLLIKLLYNFADKIVVTTKEEKENLIKNYSIKKGNIEVIYNPIDTRKINELKLENLEKHDKLFQNNKFTFITVGRLTYQKNHKLLITVFKKFNQKYPNSQLIILGEGELKKELEKQIGNNKNIHLLGNQQNPYKFLYNSDCFVLTSRYEGMPGALLESLACGLPVISSDCSTGPKEILKRNVENFEEVKNVSLESYGILVPVYDEEKYLNAMEKIYLNENLRRNYQNRSLKRSKSFEIRRIIKKWLKIL